MEESDQLKEVGLKITLPRLKVLKIFLESTAHHLSAENIYRTFLDMGEDVSFATIYRVLSQFEAAGLVTRHHFEGGHSVFELTKGSHHDHLVCISCGHVEEFFDAVIEERQQKIAKTSNFHMTDHALTLYGVCLPCQEENS